jgi:hypothetical protein
MARERHIPAREPPPPQPLGQQSALAKFRNLKGRAIEIGFAPIGPAVKAENPEELSERVDEATVDATLKQRPS